MKRRNKDSGGTTSSEDVGPSSLVQIIIYVIYVAATLIRQCRLQKLIRLVILLFIRPKKKKKLIKNEDRVKNRVKMRWYTLHKL